jgi:hypothetical protein
MRLSLRGLPAITLCSSIVATAFADFVSEVPTQYASIYVEAGLREDSVDCETYAEESAVEWDYLYDCNLFASADQPLPNGFQTSGQAETGGILKISASTQVQTTLADELSGFAGGSVELRTSFSTDYAVEVLLSHEIVVSGSGSVWFGLFSYNAQTGCPEELLFSHAVDPHVGEVDSWPSGVRLESGHYEFVARVRSGSENCPGDVHSIGSADVAYTLYVGPPGTGRRSNDENTAAAPSPPAAPRSTPPAPESATPPVEPELPDAEVRARISPWVVQSEEWTARSEEPADDLADASTRAGNVGQAVVANDDAGAVDVAPVEELDAEQLTGRCGAGLLGFVPLTMFALLVRHRRV